MVISFFIIALCILAIFGSFFFLNSNEEDDQINERYIRDMNEIHTAESICSANKEMNRIMCGSRK